MSGAVSPEELRQQITSALHAEDCGCPDLFDGIDPEGWNNYLAMADAILALPAIRRALARDAEIDSTNEMESAPMSQALRSYYAFEDGHNHLLRRLRAVGTE